MASEKAIKISEYKNKKTLVINGKEYKKKLDRDFLINLFGDIDDIYEGTDDEVLQELELMGIDIEKAKLRFNKIVEKYLEAKNGK